MGFRRGMLFTLGAYVQGLIDIMKSKILALNGVFEAESCLLTELNSLNTKSLLQDATIVITPNGVNEGILHHVKGNPIVAAPYNQHYESTVSSGGSNGVTGSTQTVLDPFGVTRSVSVISESNTNVPHRLTHASYTVNELGVSYTASVYLKKGNGVSSADIWQLYLTNGFSATHYANFNVVTGVVTDSLGCTASINNIGLSSGWWRCIITVTSTAVITTTSFNVAGVNNNPTAGRLPTYLGTNLCNFYFAAIQFEKSPSASTYQQVAFTPLLHQGYVEHTRTTTAYRTDSLGNVKEVPQENLVPYSEQFYNWTQLSTPTHTINVTDSNSPTGKYQSIIDSSGAAAQYVRTAIAGINVVGQVFSFRVFVRKNASVTYNRIAIGDSNSINITFNSATGAFITNLTSANVVSYNVDYWEVTGTGTAAIGNFSLVPNVGSLIIGSTSTAATGTISVAYAQVIAGATTPTIYYPTLARTNTPRTDYTDGSCPTILMEGAATNRIVRSEEFDNASWVKSNLTVTANSHLAPNGLVVADTLTATSNNGYITQNVTPGSNFSIFSVYIKRKTGTGNITLETGNQSLITTINSSTWTRVFLLNTNNNGNYSAVSGTYTVTTVLPHNLITGDSVFFDAVGGGGADYAVPSVTVTGANTFTFVNGAVTGGSSCNIYAAFGRIKFQTSGDEVYAWGAQLEYATTTLLNSYYEPTSYIPTTNNAVTKTADVFYKYKIRENNLLNNTWSIFFECKKIGGTGDILLIADAITGTPQNNIAIIGAPLSVTKRDNNVLTTLVSTGVYQPSATAYFKVLITCNNGTIEVWIDGTKLATTSFVNYSLLTILGAIGIVGITRYKQILGWNKVLTRVELDLLFEYPYYNAGYTPVNNELQQKINRAHYEGFTIPSIAKLGYEDTLITEMKNDGVWTLTDYFTNFAENDVTLTNWRRINIRNAYGKLYGMCTLNGAISSQVDGFKGDGVSAFIDTNLNPAVLPLNYTLNSAGRFAVVSQAVTIGSAIDGSQSIVLNQMLNQFAAQQRINQSSNVLAVGFSLAGTGLKSIMRDSSTAVRLQSSATLHSTTATSTSINSVTQKLMISNLAYSDINIACYWMGGSLTNSQIANFRTYYNTFLVANGLTAFA